MTKIRQELRNIVIAQPKPNQAKPTQIRAGLDLVMPLFLFLRFSFLKIFFTPKLPIGPIQSSSNLIGPKQSQANFNQLPANQVPVNEYEYEYESIPIPIPIVVTAQP